MPINKPETFKQIKLHMPKFFAELKEINDTFGHNALGIKTNEGAWWFGEFDPPKDLTVKTTHRRY